MDFYPLNGHKLINLRCRDCLFWGSLAHRTHKKYHSRVFSRRNLHFFQKSFKPPKISGGFGPKMTKMDFYPQKGPKVINLRRGDCILRVFLAIGLLKKYHLRVFSRNNLHFFQNRSNPPKSQGGFEQKTIF